MRWFIGTLIALNLGILLWGWMGDEKAPSPELAAPGVGSIRLLGEEPVAAEPVAVPIPAPSRTSDAKEAVATADTDVAAVAAPAAAADVPQAQPLSDTDAAPDTAATSPARSTAVAPSETADANITAPEPEAFQVVTEQHCSRIGPFDSAADAKATRTYLASHGKVSDHKAAGQVHVGYWVLIPPAASRSAAEATAARLKAKGIKDLWIVSKGEAKNGISLGVFSQKENADNFVKRAKAKGFKTEVRNKTKPGQQWWLDYTGSKVISTADIKSSAPAGVTAVSQSCR